MRPIKNILTYTLPLLLVLSLALRCTFTTTRQKDPVLIANADSIAAKIRTLILTRNVNVSGTQKTTNGKASAELTIRLINPLNEPADPDRRFQLGKQIATIIKQSIQNPEEYSVYTVLFVKEETDGESAGDADQNLGITADRYKG